MTITTRRELTEIAEHYGIFTQLGKLNEELEELGKAAQFYQTEFANGMVDMLPKTRESMIEEMADTLIMIQQIAILTDSWDETDLMINYKIDRQMIRLEKDEKEEKDGKEEQ